MIYRADIDGLRALAVISVVIFHFGDLDGGFVGVDMFFVISGFLITKLIDDDITAGSFGLTDFYVRRIRRILPAAFAVYFATALFALCFMFSVDAEFIGRALLSCIFFVSNIFFYNEIGYFEKSTLVNPLLHIWSLSVEEQFYIVLPFLLVGLGYVSKAKRVLVLGSIALASFAASIWMVQHDPTAAFYLMQYRAWEFLCGGLLAIGAVPVLRERHYAEYAAALGLLLIIGSVALMSKEVPFPGLGALAPCLGAGLIIHAGTCCQTRVTRLLSTPPLRFIGLISYSLYLWHYPVVVAYRGLMGKSSFEAKLALMALSFALAAASWRFIETPFRKRRRGPAPTAPYRVFAAAAGVMVLLAVVAAPLGRAARIVQGETPAVVALLSHMSADHLTGWRGGECFLTRSGDFERFKPAKCLAVKPNQKNFLILGDSHAAHLWPGLSQAFPQLNFLQANASGCWPILNTEGDEHCTKLMGFMFEKYLPQHHLDGIIMAGRWRPGDVENIKRTALVLKAFADRVIVFGSTVEYQMPLPRILAAHLSNVDDEMMSEYRKAAQQQLDLKLGRALEGTPVEYVSVYRAICAPQCSVWAQGDHMPMQFDYGHFTPAGSLELARRVGRQLFPGIVARQAAAVQ